ncbi:hypothetical protein A2837_00930 [Candidatus Kaiserbacteria bacterium RIFCSPHIGHO2_01_FULL_46_22]|uniref:Uncharacterized protein n=1 Tax=Candidatus Kaiserbacteria bacterium RIFCSPHIGHO2_01_FULL_46_22 TaxID=1798475 RepID=A0A1F6BY73_9BACT|nr:MAG: hypothetical protein A2837_00930 [Candidatus Kaiserbacteria bacterium RIFCSPHIGHO2_01_FULL_46_22]
MLPDWTGKAVAGAAVGAVAAMIVGFAWGGWMTSGSAATMAKAESQKAVVAALTPICVKQAEVDPERTVKLAALGALSSYQRSDELVKTGWATMPGHDKPADRAVISACLNELAKSLK